MSRLAIVSLLAAMLLGIAACGNGDDEDDAVTDDAAEPTPAEEVTDDDPDPTPVDDDATDDVATDDDPEPTPIEDDTDDTEPTPEPEPTPVEDDDAVEDDDTAVEPADPEVSTYIDGVNMPSSITFAPDGRMFFIEVWDGNIHVVEDGQMQDEPFATLDIVQVEGFTEWGLLGLALHPDFEENGWVYAFHTVPDDAGNPAEQRIVRFTDDGNTGIDEEVIVDGLPYGPSCCHNGGRMTFGPDGHLYVSLGDTEQEAVSQDPENIAGSVLRYTEDGAVPDDNPFGEDNPVYAYGLRNPYGLAFHPDTDELWITENGPNGFDEVNLIEAGENYGWPEARGFEGEPEHVDPIWATGQSEAIGPTGIEVPTGEAIPDLAGNVLFCDWNTATARVLEISDEYEVLDESEVPVDCNLDVTEGPDAALYLSSNEAIFRYGPPAE